MPAVSTSRIALQNGGGAARNAMLKYVRDFNWAATPAGPMESWPQELQTASRIVLFSSTPMAVLIGAEGIVLANDAMWNVLGPDYGRGMGKPVAKVLKHSADFAQKMLHRALQGHSSRFQDIPLPISDSGSVRQAWFDLEFTPVVDADGHAYGALVICIETTQRVKALAELESSRERLNLALESGGVIGVWEVDFETNVVRSDARYAILHNVDPQIAATGAQRDIFIAGIHPDDRLAVLQAFEQAKITGTYRCQHRVTGNTGTRWIVASGRIKHDMSGKPLSFTGTAVDVTEQLDVSAALAESEKRFRTYAETLPHIIFGWDSAGHPTYANRLWSEFTGCDEGDPQLWNWISFIHPDEQASIADEWARAINAQSPLSFEARHRHVSGGYRWMRAVASPIYGANNELTGWIGTLTDIHEEKLVEEERELVSKELDHRIKNFFALTNGLVNLTAREVSNDASFAERLQSRLTALYHSHNLIRQYDGMGAGNSFTLHALIRQLLAPYAIADAPENIIVDGDDLSLQPQEVTAFALVIHELATNAAKYGALSSKDGRLHVSSRYHGGMLTIMWREQGHRWLESGTSSGGFGSRMINVIVERQMNGRFERYDTEEGITFQLEMPRK